MGLAISKLNIIEYFRELSIIDVINAGTLIFLCLLAGFTLGMVYGNGTTACQSMIKMYGCNLDGMSDLEVCESIVERESNCDYSNTTRVVTIKEEPKMNISKIYEAYKGGLEND